MKKISVLQAVRASYQPKTPPALANGALVDIIEGQPTTAAGDTAKIKELFPNGYGAPEITFKKSSNKQSGKPINVGVILSGGQAPGGHNVIAGIYDGVKSISSESKVFGFLKGPDGLIKNNLIELTSEIIDQYRNTGGFDMIGSGRTKLETEEHFIAAQKHCEARGISTLVIIGGDDSNTNACLLAEYFRSRKIAINVIGCPKTIDGDLKNDCIETSFGFDTACRVYSELVGNIARDANSAQKYWHFIKLMGRSASHITLECALQTQPNITIISEEVEAQNMTLEQLVDNIAQIVFARAAKGNNFGVALIPEGLIEFIPEIKKSISSLNDLLARKADELQQITDFSDKIDLIKKNLDPDAAKVFNSLPKGIQIQLCLDRDPHGNVQVSLIETEKMLAEMVGQKLKTMAGFAGKFSTQTHFLGYEGRCSAPSNYDADYCYSLGFTAAALANAGRTGYMAVVRNTIKPASEWIAGGVPITMMMNIERRHGEEKPVIRKALTELDGAPFKYLAANREQWAKGTEYVYPGPIQYFGPTEVCDLVSKTLELEQQSK